MTNTIAAIDGQRFSTSPISWMGAVRFSARDRRILIAGKTIRYREARSLGLAGYKRVIVAVSRGNLYAAGVPTAADEHVETYLKAVFHHVAVTPEFVIAGGPQVGQEQRHAAIAQAKHAIGALAA